MSRYLIFLISSFAFHIIFAYADVRDVIPGGILCRKEGLMCKDCMTLVKCVQDANDFAITVIEACSNDAPCDEIKKSCVVGGTCRYKPFECSGLPDDTYPDPYSCRQYHICKAGHSQDLSCPFPKAYNPTNKKCELKLSDKLCTEGIGVCENANQHLVMKNLFMYTCTAESKPYKTIYPKLDTTLQCNSDPYIPDPNDCYGYYYCNKASDGHFDLIHRCCRKGSHFDDAQNKCVRGPCKNVSDGPSCQSELLQKNE